MSWLAPALAAALILQFEPPAVDAIRAAPTFARDDRLVATHYFYWYRNPDSHFDALRLHFPDKRSVSFVSEAWHLREMRDARAAGIDVVLPVYWGAVDRYDKLDVAFSVKGLPPLVAALDAMARAGEAPPRVGLFYDTTTLLNDVRGALPGGGRVDLRTDGGRDVFYRTIRDFFFQVPPRHWARIGGQPLVVLYSAGFAAGHDQRAFDELSDRFARDFDGLRPFVVRDASWTNARTAASTAWGAALHGPALLDGVAQIGPGYDDTPVPGRTTPIREREDGLFYEKSWRAALASGRDIVIVETWNEHHEGTSIAETVEYGRRYIEITARYAALFKKRETIADDIVLTHPEPRPRADLSWGKEAKGARSVSYVAGSEPREGLRPVAHEDGSFRPTVLADGTRAIVSAASTYLYFQVSDHFALDESADFEVDVEFRDVGEGSVGLEFDSRDDAATLRGAYTAAGDFVRRGREEWRTERFFLDDARFANRQNGGSDFRLAVRGSSCAVRAVRVRRAIDLRVTGLHGVPLDAAAIERDIALLASAGDPASVRAHVRENWESARIVVIEWEGEGGAVDLDGFLHHRDGLDWNAAIDAPRSANRAQMPWKATVIERRAGRVRAAFYLHDVNAAEPLYYGRRPLAIPKETPAPAGLLEALPGYESPD